MFKSWLADLAQQIMDWKAEQPGMLPFMPYANADGDGKDPYVKRSSAIFEAHYGNLAAEFALIRGFTEFQPVAEWLARIPVEGVLPNDYKADGDTDVPHEFATIYHARTKDEKGDRSDDNPVYETWCKLINKTAEIDDQVKKAIAAGSGTQAFQNVYASSDNYSGKPGQFLRYPNSAFGGPALLRAALACVKKRQLHPGADKAWDRLVSVDTSDFSVCPKYNWLPVDPVAAPN